MLNILPSTHLYKSSNKKEHTLLKKLELKKTEKFKELKSRTKKKKKNFFSLYS